MEITLSDVWERRLNTMVAARCQSPEEVMEEALATLYFMTVAPREQAIAEEPHPADACPRAGQ